MDDMLLIIGTWLITIALFSILIALMVKALGERSCPNRVGR